MNVTSVGAGNDVSLRVGVERGQYKIALWVNNVLNGAISYSTGRNIRNNDFIFENLVNYPDKRTCGATATVKF